MARLLDGLINLIIGIAEAFLVLRFMLKLFGASSSAAFVAWVYETSAPLLAPFAGMFPTPVLEGRFILEFSTLFAILAYAVLGFLLSSLIRAVTFSSRRWE